jgi:hypothetical protein
LVHDHGIKPAGIKPDDRKSARTIFEEVFNTVQGTTDNYADALQLIQRALQMEKPAEIS